MTEQEQPDAAEDTKRKFREALERKKQQAGSYSGAPSAQAPQGGPHAKASGGKREFRRKAG